MNGAFEAGGGPDSRERVSYVTASVAGQLFGLPIDRVHDVFNLGTLTSVPLSPPDIIGLTNFRGRVVTALDIRQRLGLPPVAVAPGAMAIGIGAGGDSYGLVVDRIGEIVSVERDALQPCPIHLDQPWAALCSFVHATDDGLLLLLDVDAMIEPAPHPTNTPRATESPQ